MELNCRLYDHFHEKAQGIEVETLCIGLSYTAVTTADGGIGIAYTYVDNRRCCSKHRDYRDYEGARAVDLLSQIRSPDPLHRGMGLALVNALNYRDACGFPEDSNDRFWMDSFNIGPETRVAMVGFFRPLMGILQDRGALVEVLDDFQGVGDRSIFYRKLSEWAEVLILTSTSILNDSTEEVLGRLAPGAKTIMLGPSTPMVAEAFGHLPVHILAGTVPVDKEAVLKAVRHGVGTPVIHRFSRKVCLTIDDK
ncbi:MAG: DUF364 domain-containing protein [Syntrophobacter sp.]